MENLNNFLEEINRLKKRSNLLEEILKYYNYEKGVFEIPKKWKTKLTEKQILQAGENPMQNLKMKIEDNLEEEKLFEIKYR